MALKSDIAYLIDIFNIFNDLNLQLQGRDVNLIKAKSKITTSLDQLSFHSTDNARRNLSQFPNLYEQKMLTVIHLC